jgi:hypothetical protein
MDIKADAGRRRPVDMRSHCERVDLRANSNGEASWLAALYRAIVFGGEITVKLHKEEEPHVIEFGDANPEGRTAANEVKA